MTESILSYVHAIKYEADNIFSYELRKYGDCNLPKFTAGSHVELSLADGLTRCYSLFNNQDDCNVYKIAVAKDPDGRGGSKFIHEKIKVGQVVKLSPPRNNFELCETAPKSILIAGGIGITPLWSMAQRLASLGKDWELHYLARSPEKAALLEEVGQCLDNVSLIFTDKPASSETYLAELLDRDDGRSHYYCCGPSGMLESFIEKTRLMDRERIHWEYFAGQQSLAVDGGFIIELKKSSKSIRVEPGKTILDALLDNHVEVIHSCREGICGACEVSLIEGEADHRDSILTEEERNANNTIFVCCSGSKTDRLVLDL